MQKIEENRQTRYRESYRIYNKHATVQQDQKHRKSCPQLPFPRENGSHCSKLVATSPLKGSSLAKASPGSSRAEATQALSKPLTQRVMIPAECWTNLTLLITHCALQPPLYKGQTELTPCQPALWPPRQGLTSLARLIRAKQVSDSTRKGLLWPISPHLTKPAEGYSVVEYILSIKLVCWYSRGGSECREKIHAICIHLGFHGSY